MDRNKHVVCFNVGGTGHIMPTRLIVQEMVKRGIKVTYVVKHMVQDAESQKIKQTINDLGCEYVNFADISLFDTDAKGPSATVPLMLGATDDLLKWIKELQPFPTAILYDPFAAYGYLIAQILNIPCICSISYFCTGGELSYLEMTRKLEEKYSAKLIDNEFSKSYPWAYKDSLNILFTVEEMLQGLFPEEEQKYLFFAGTMISERKDPNTLLNSSLVSTLKEKKKRRKKNISNFFGNSNK